MKSVSTLLSFACSIAVAQQVTFAPHSTWAGEAVGVQIDLPGDSLAYVTGAAKGLSVVDFRVPGDVRVVGSINPRPGNGGVRAWPMINRRALLSTGDWKGVYLIDLSKPAVPVVLDSLPLRPVNGMASRDSIAFLPYYQRGLACYKISATGKFDSLSFLQLPGSSWDVFVRDTLAVVGGGTSGLHILSVRDPMTPRLLSTGAAPSSGHVFQATLAGDLVWAATGDGYVALYDATNPKAARLIKSKKIDTYAYRIVNHSGHIFISHQSGVNVYDATDSTLTPIGSWSSNASNPWIHGIAANDSLVFALDHQGNGLSILKWRTLEKIKLLAPLALTREVKPTFSWTSVDGAASYTFVLADNALYANPSISLTFSDTMIQSPVSLHGGTWWWKVMATPGGQVATGAFSVYADTLPYLYAFAGDTLNESSPVFAWSPAKGYTGSYQLQLSVESGFSAAMALSTSDTVLKFPASLAKGKWFWRVTTTRGSSQLDSFYLDPKVNVGVQGDVRIPVMTMAHKVLRMATVEPVAAYGLGGRLVARAWPISGQVTINLAKESAGLYLLRGTNWSRTILLP